MNTPEIPKIIPRDGDAEYKARFEYAPVNNPIRRELSRAPDTFPDLIHSTGSSLRPEFEVDYNQLVVLTMRKELLSILSPCTPPYILQALDYVSLAFNKKNERPPQTITSYLQGRGISAPTDEEVKIAAKDIELEARTIRFSLADFMRGRDLADKKEAKRQLLEFLKAAVSFRFLLKGPIKSRGNKNTEEKYLKKKELGYFFSGVSIADGAAGIDLERINADAREKVKSTLSLSGGVIDDHEMARKTDDALWKASFSGGVFSIRLTEQYYNALKSLPQEPYSQLLLKVKYKTNPNTYHLASNLLQLAFIKRTETYKISVLNLLNYAPYIPSQEALKARGQRNFKRYIITPLQRDLNAVPCLKWKYLDATGEEVTQAHALALPFPKWEALSVQITLAGWDLAARPKLADKSAERKEG